jgi:hypothetical protein
MPVCKNDIKRSYKGDEPSPKGLGYCAHAMEIGTVMKGLDNNLWIISVDKNKVRRWIKYVDNKFVLNQYNNKSVTSTTPLMFADNNIIIPKDVYNLVKNNEIIHTLYNKIIPKLMRQEINCYIVPLTLSPNNVYWSDYANTYLNHFTVNEWNNGDYITITLYFDQTTTLNIKENIRIDYSCSIEKQQILADIFSKFLPNNYIWDGNDKVPMEISFVKGEKGKKIVAKEISNYPYFRVEIDYNAYDKVNLYEESKDFDILRKYAKTYKWISYEINTTYISIEMYGVLNSEKLIAFFKNLKKTKKLTHNNNKITIKKINLWTIINEESKEKRLF